MMAAVTEDRYKTALTCGICKEILTDPRTLSCLHTYCNNCLKSLIEKCQHQEGVINCPECRHECTIPQEGLKVSPTIAFLVDAFKNSHQTKIPECEACSEKFEKQTPAKICCLDCSKKFCDTCCKIHDMLMKDHKLLEITGDVEQDMQTAVKSIKERTVYCQKHPSKPIELYCKVDKAVICQLCYPINHPGHACEDIKDIAPKSLKPIGAVITQGNGLMEMYEQAIQDTQAYKSELEKHAETITAEINNDMNTLIQAIRRKYKFFTDEVMREKESNLKQIISHLGHLELQKAIIEGQVNKYSTYIEHGHPVEIVGLVEQVKQKSEEWSKAPNTSFNDRLEIKFTGGKCDDDGVKFGTLEVKKLPTPQSDYVLTPLCDPTVSCTNLHSQIIFDLAITSAGDYVVTGRNSSPTCFYDKCHNLKKTLDKNFFNVTKMHDGDLAFTDGTNRISIYDEDGNYKHEVVCRELKNLNGITMNSTGDLMVIDRGRKQIYRIDIATGKATRQPGILHYSEYLKMNSKQVSIISEVTQHCIKGVAPDGTDVFTYGTKGSGSGQLKFPHGVCRDREDYIFVADSNNDRVILLTPDGRFLKNVLTKANGVIRPRAVAISQDGRLLVGDYAGRLFSVKYRE